jgi:hypothetical protein
VVVVVADHRPDQADVVGDAAQVREQLAELRAALPVLVELERAAHQQVVLAAGLEALDVSGVLLAVALLQLRFGVEEVDLARPADLHQQDHGLGPAGEVAGPRPQVAAAGKSRGPAVGSRDLPAHEVRERQRPQSEAGLQQEGPARKGRLWRVSGRSHGRPHST